MRMRYQLAHEAVHCLAPVRRPDTIYFEEGLAVEFSLHVSGLNRQYRRQCEKQLNAVLRRPYDAVEALKVSDVDIRRLRSAEPCFDKFDPALLERMLGISADRAHSVCQRMAATRPEGM